MPACSHKTDPKSKQINKALKLWEEVGEKLRALAGSPARDQTEVDELLSFAEQLLNELGSFAQSEERGSEQPAELTRRVTSISIPEKQYHKIGEVTAILDREPYVPRYWESEFKILKQTLKRATQSLCTAKDLEIFKEIPAWRRRQIDYSWKNAIEKCGGEARNTRNKIGRMAAIAIGLATTRKLNSGTLHCVICSPGFGGR